MVLAFGIEADDPLAGLTEIREDELEEIALTLTGVTEDEDVGCGLIFGSAVEVHEDVRAVLISANIQTVGIGLAGEVEGIEIGNAGGRQYALVLCAELIEAHGKNGEESFFLP